MNTSEEISARAVINNSGTPERKAMSAELKAAYARHSALDLELAEALAKLGELQKHAATLRAQLSEAERERTRLAKLEGYI